MCKCGCGTCETKITGPLLTESKVKSLLSEGLNHHISNAIPLHETVYRYGSVKHLSLIKEARKLYSRNVIDLNEFDTELVKTHLGEWGLFEGESVPLDLPMMNEREDALGIYDDGKGNSAAIEWTPNGYLATVEGEYDFQIGPAKTVEELIKMLADEGFTNKIFEALKTGTYAGRKVIVHMDGAETDWEVEFENGKKVSYIDVMANLKFDDGTTYMDYLKEEANNNIETLIKLVKSANNPKNLPISFGTTSVAIGGTQYDKGELTSMFNGRELGMDSMDIRKVFYNANQDAEAVADEINASNSGVIANIEFGYGKKPILYLKKGTNLDEAKKKKPQKKDPPIGKPKRGGSKAYYVYVRDPKTKKIKKVSFGSGGLRAKINNPKARNAFAKRHRCSTKNDRTKPGYWSCRLPRYAKALGLGNNKNTFW